MAKKVRFPLKMADEFQVRTLEELQEHFDLVSVLEYYDNGKLVEWLTDRYYEEEAEKIKALKSSAKDFKKRLCEIFGADYTDDKAEEADLEAISAKNERRERLKEFTADDTILAAADRVAFSQEDLADLLDEDIKEIYLCGEKFKIPGSKKGVKYIGVNNPKVDVPDEYTAKGIVFQGVDLGLNEIESQRFLVNPIISSFSLHEVNNVADKTLKYIRDSYDIAYKYKVYMEKSARWILKKRKPDPQWEQDENIKSELSEILGFDIKKYDTPYLTDFEKLKKSIGKNFNKMGLTLACLCDLYYELTGVAENESKLNVIKSFFEKLGRDLIEKIGKPLYIDQERRTEDKGGLRLISNGQDKEELDVLQNTYNVLSKLLVETDEFFSDISTMEERNRLIDEYSNKSNVCNEISKMLKDICESLDEMELVLLHLYELFIASECFDKSKHNIIGEFIVGLENKLAILNKILERKGSWRNKTSIEAISLLFGQKDETFIGANLPVVQKDLNIVCKNKIRRKVLIAANFALRESYISARNILENYTSEEERRSFYDYYNEGIDYDEITDEIYDELYEKYLLDDFDISFTKNQLEDIAAKTGLTLIQVQSIRMDCINELSDKMSLKDVRSNRNTKNIKWESEIKDSQPPLMILDSSFLLFDGHKAGISFQVNSTLSSRVTFDSDEEV